MAKNFIVVTVEEVNGKTEIMNKKAVRLLFETAKPGKYVVTIDSANQRSTQQNKYYWGVVVWMCRKGMNDLGHDLDSDEVHSFLKGRFNYTEIVNKETGQMERIPRSTTKLNKEQFADYLEKIIQFAAEFLNTTIEPPNTQTSFDYGNEQLYEGTPSEGAGYTSEETGITKGGPANA